MASHRFIAIVPKAYKDGINQDALAFDPKGGEKTVSVPLYDKNGTLTHYWFSAQVSERTWQAMQALISSKYPLVRVEEWDTERYPELPDTMLNELKLYRPAGPK